MVSFTKTSGGDYDRVLWDFGDGEGGAWENPTHLYADPGSYTVTLTEEGPGGNDSEIKAGCIDVRFGMYLPLVISSRS